MVHTLLQQHRLHYYALLWVTVCCCMYCFCKLAVACVACLMAMVLWTGISPQDNEV